MLRQDTECRMVITVFVLAIAVIRTPYQRMSSNWFQRMLELHVENIVGIAEDGRRSSQGTIVIGLKMDLRSAFQQMLPVSRKVDDGNLGIRQGQGSAGIKIARLGLARKSVV